MRFMSHDDFLGFLHSWFPYIYASLRYKVQSFPFVWGGGILIPAAYYQNQNNLLNT